jgi:hypothetical protein
MFNVLAYTVHSVSPTKKWLFPLGATNSSKSKKQVFNITKQRKNHKNQVIYNEFHLKNHEKEEKKGKNHSFAPENG